MPRLSVRWNPFYTVSNIPQEWLTALETTYADMIDGKVQIVTCELFRVEVWGNQLSGQSLQAYNDLMGCKYFEIVAPRSSTYELARDYRQRCKQAAQSLATPDSLHIASANQIGVDEIWTTDTKLTNKYHAGLLGTTKICHPHVNQLRLNIWEPS